MILSINFFPGLACFVFSLLMIFWTLDLLCSSDDSIPFLQLFLLHLFLLLPLLLLFHFLFQGPEEIRPQRGVIPRSVVEAGEADDGAGGVGSRVGVGGVGSGVDDVGIRGGRSVAFWYKTTPLLHQETVPGETE